MRNTPLARLVPIASAVTLCLIFGYIVFDERVRAQDSVVELLESLEMTKEQKADFQALETLRKESQAKLKQLKGEELRAAREAFQAKRKAALQELFTEQQWKRWDDYWTAHFSRPNNAPTPQPQENPVIFLNRQFLSMHRISKKPPGGSKSRKMKRARHSWLRLKGKPFFSLGVTHIVAIGASHCQRAESHRRSLRRRLVSDGVESERESSRLGIQFDRLWHAPSPGKADPFCRGNPYGRHLHVFWEQAVFLSGRV